MELFRLWFEYLPSEEPIHEMLRERRRKQQAEDKKLAKEFAAHALTLPAIRRKVVAQLRRVKR